jgi:hypothetical protein
MEEKYYHTIRLKERYKLIKKGLSGPFSISDFKSKNYLIS